MLCKFIIGYDFYKFIINCAKFIQSNLCYNNCDLLQAYW